MTFWKQQAFGCRFSELYTPFDDGMGPAIEATASAIKQLCPNARTILDLGSGHGEPGCTVAARFPSAAVICSDVSQSMLDLAAKRAADKSLANLSTMILDLGDLRAIGAASQDVVTANFVMQNAADLQASLREIHRVLKPGGVLVGTLWQVFSVPTVAAEVCAELMALPAPGPEAEKDSGTMRLADVEMVNREFSEAHFEFCEGHDSAGETSFNVGEVAGDAWKHVMLSHLTKLEEMEKAGDTSVQERTRAAVEKAAVACGYVKEGVLCMPGTFRNFRVAKPAVA